MGQIYFAFGSNMDPAQMRGRCPGAWLLGQATLEGHRLRFSGYSAAWAGPVADVTPHADARVPGLLWWLDDLDLARLDDFEGHPWAYRRRRVAVVDDRGRQRQAQLYARARREPPGTPSWAYLWTLWQAYVDRGFDAGPLLRAARGG